MYRSMPLLHKLESMYHIYMDKATPLFPERGWLNTEFHWNAEEFSSPRSDFYLYTEKENSNCDIFYTSHTA